MKNNNLSVITFILLTVLLYMFNPKVSYSKSSVVDKTRIQKLLKEGKLAKWGSSPEDIFINLFQDCLDSNAKTKQPGIGNNEYVQIIGFTSQGINKKESTEIFGTADNINNIHYTCKVILADSICAFYGIERKDLIDIRQNKHLMGKKKKEINGLFENCLEMMHKKFDRDKMIEIITEKVLQKQNEPLVPTVPDCPPLIW